VKQPNLLVASMNISNNFTVDAEVYSCTMGLLLKKAWLK